MSKTNYWQEIETAFEQVDIYEGPDVFARDAAKYPDWKIDLLAVHWTMSEIVNGGLAQYFENATAVLAPEAVRGFQNIGRSDLSTALQKAMRLLGEEYPREQQLRAERLTALTGKAPTEGQSFSLIPKWVAKKAGMDQPASPFSEFDDLFTSASDAVEEAMDSYAVAKTS